MENSKPAADGVLPGGLLSYPQTWRLDGPGKHDHVSLPTVDIFAFGLDNELDGLRPPTPEKTSAEDHSAPKQAEGAKSDLSMAHNFPVYVEELSVCSNGVSLTYREP